MLDLDTIASVSNLNDALTAEGLAYRLQDYGDGSWAILDDDEEAFGFTAATERDALALAKAFLGGTFWETSKAVR